jgi:hypothetical protein
VFDDCCYTSSLARGFERSFGLILDAWAAINLRASFVFRKAERVEIFLGVHPAFFAVDANLEPEIVAGVGVCNAARSDAEAAGIE